MSFEPGTVEPKRVRRGSLGGVPPQLADLGEVEAGQDALHVGEDHGSDVQVRIEDRAVRIGYPNAGFGRHGCVARAGSETSGELQSLLFLGFGRFTQSGHFLSFLLT
jgi:hypothetical protein